MSFKISKSKNKKPSTGFIKATGYPIIDNLLLKTRGTMPYQETLMQLFATICEIPFGSADSIRRIIGKKYDMSIPKEAKIILEAKSQWMNGCKKHGIDDLTANLWWDKILANNGYSFNLSHAVAYSVLTFETMWYRKNYPTEFMAARMTMYLDEIGFWLQKAAIEGIEVVAPNVNISHATDFTVKDGKIYMPLVSLKGFGISSVNAIVENRPYEDLKDFRGKNSKREVNNAKIFALWMMKAFDGLGGDYEDLECDRVITPLPSGGVSVEYKGEVEYFNGNYDYYSKFLSNAILYNKKLMKKIELLSSSGYKFGVISKIEHGKTQTGKDNIKVYTGTNAPSLYIGNWVFDKIETKLGRMIQKGDFIAFNVNSKFGAYLNDVDIEILNDYV